ncbi:MAG: sugar phosphate isomerase/epimerase [Kiritimatiellae bacterium]|nr:sugar phosphate isomerase/epimerase [Kiritimatiellia bacterium]MDD5519682.1 sugar phosphate isomerase/epimerase [Kiritimatiellia bacterium]
MSVIISCRTSLFSSLEEAFPSLREAGICHAEVPPAVEGDYKGMVKLASKSGITIATFATRLNVETDASAAELRPVIDNAGSFGIPKIFVGVKAPDTISRDIVYARLRDIAKYAWDHKVVLCMETHPPVGTNGDVARETLEAVNHPGLRFNFDTANIYYYNHDTNSVHELRKVAKYVAAVHLKDTDGGFNSFNFPVLGKGVVDFKGVFQILAELEFKGPYTIEAEGPLVSDLTRDQKVTFLKDSMAYLKSIGVI